MFWKLLTGHRLRSLGCASECCARDDGECGGGGALTGLALLGILSRQITGEGFGHRWERT